MTRKQMVFNFEFEKRLLVLAIENLSRR